jgi:hypothetical protein
MGPYRFLQIEYRAKGLLVISRFSNSVYRPVILAVVVPLPNLTNIVHYQRYLCKDPQSLANVTVPRQIVFYLSQYMHSKITRIKTCNRYC